MKSLIVGTSILGASSLSTTNINGNYNMNVAFGNNVAIGSGGMTGTTNTDIDIPNVVNLPVVAASRLSSARGFRQYTNVAPSMKASVSSEYPASAYSSVHLNDGYFNTEWSTDGSQYKTCEESVTFTLTSNIPTSVDAFGFLSRDMMNDDGTGDSAFTALSVSVDGVGIIKCDTKVSGSELYNTWKSTLPIPLCKLPARVTGSIFEFKASGCITGEYNNFGLREIELYKADDVTPNPSEIGISKIPQCTTDKELPEQLTWPPFTDVNVLNSTSQQINLWDVNNYLKGYSNFHDHPSGTWLCAITASGAALFDSLYLVSAGYAGYVDILITNTKLPSGLGMPNGGKSTGNPPREHGKTYMMELNEYCTELQVTEPTNGFSFETKNAMIWVCELLYASVLQYRLEAYLASVPGAESFSLPEGKYLKTTLLQKILGGGDLPPVNVGTPYDTIQVGPMTLQTPLSTYIYKTRPNALIQQSNNGHVLSSTLLTGLPFTIFDYTSASGIWDGHMRILLEGGKGTGDDSMNVVWMGDTWYPPHFEICATSRQFFDRLKQIPSKVTNRPLVCSPLIQKYLYGVSELLGLEKSLRYGSNELDESKIGNEPNGANIVGGTPSMCDMSNTNFLGPRFMNAYGSMAQQASFFPCPAKIVAGDFTGLITATETGFGLYGQQVLGIDSYAFVYKYHIGISALHIPPMNNFCKGLPDDPTQQWDTHWGFQPWGVVGLSAPFGDVVGEIKFNHMYMWAQITKYDSQWTSWSDVSNPTSGNNICNREARGDCRITGNAAADVMCSSPGTPPYWFTHGTELLTHRNELYALKGEVMPM
jgi:hypothetical protein